MFPSVLLPSAVEDPRGITAFKVVHGAAKDWMWRSQWDRHPAHTAMVLTSAGVHIRELDQGLLRPESTIEHGRWPDKYSTFDFNSWPESNVIGTDVFSSLFTHILLTITYTKMQLIILLHC